MQRGPEERTGQRPEKRSLIRGKKARGGMKRPENKMKWDYRRGDNQQRKPEEREEDQGRGVQR